jgi:hypothetical protein
MFDRLYTLFIYLYHSHLKKDQYPAALKRWFKKQTGLELDLENPRTFSEKIQWLKLYDSTQQKADLSDKYLVREWVKEKIGEKYLVELYGVWDDPDDIDFDSLPESFVLKTNHSSSWNIIVKDKSSLNIKKTRRTLKRWLSLDYSFCCGLQLHYSLIKRRVIAERYLENKDGLDDYKFLCFNGKPYYIWKDVGRFGKQHYRTFYDLDWKLQDFRYQYPSLDESDNPPQCLSEMTELARILCQGFPHVRVDFYEVDGRVYFGEMTFTCCSGIDRFYPPQMDEVMGSYFELPGFCSQSFNRS